MTAASTKCAAPPGRRDQANSHSYGIRRHGKARYACRQLFPPEPLMTDSTSARRSRSRLLALCLITIATVAVAEECTDRYYAPDDGDRLQALSRPHRDFTRMLRAANTGDAIDARNLGIAYEAGYLVAPCEEKALVWYRKAAKA